MDREIEFSNLCSFLNSERQSISKHMNYLTKYKFTLSDMEVASKLDYDIGNIQKCNLRNLLGLSLYKKVYPIVCSDFLIHSAHIISLHMCSDYIIKSLLSKRKVKNTLYKKTSKIITPSNFKDFIAKFNIRLEKMINKEEFFQLDETKNLKIHLLNDVVRPIKDIIRNVTILEWEQKYLVTLIKKELPKMYEKLGKSFVHKFLQSIFDDLVEFNLKPNRTKLETLKKDFNRSIKRKNKIVKS